MKQNTKAITSNNELGMQEFQDRIFNHYMFEMCKVAMQTDYTLSSEQMADLKKAYHANDNEKECRSSLESFFNSIPLDRFNQFDISSFTYLHILKWYDMILVADLEKEPEGTGANFIWNRILEMIIRRMPKCIKSKLWFELEVKYPEKVKEFIENYASIAKCPSCSRTGWALTCMPIPVESLIEVMTGIEPCPYPDSFLNQEGNEHSLRCA